MVTSKLKSSYKLLYYIALFGILFNFMLYPAYAVINEFPYGHRSNIYYHFVRPDGLYETAVEDEVQNISQVPETKNLVRQSFKEPEISMTESKETAAPQIIEILSNDRSGVIGYGNTSNSDDPADNIFSFNFEKSILADKEIRISYEIFGVENISGVSRSINENNATGGYVVKTNNKWNTLEETISPEQLKDGINHVIFTAFHDKRVEHEIKNVRIVGIESPEKEYFYLADNNTAFTKNNKAYVKGSVLVPNVNLYINNVKIPIHNGAFEAVIPHDSDTNSFVAELVQEQQTLATATVNLIASEESLVNAFRKRENSVFLEKTEENVFSLDSDDVTFKIDIENYKRASHITVQKLRAIDMPPLGTNIINVTSEQSGYRFLPEGAKFDTVTQLGLKFNPELLPSGYTAHDVKILYFDLDKRRWLSIPTDSILVDKNKIVGLTDHFTDYIAGIIQSPESPETASFTPTSISDIQVADPTANIVQIQPPTANQKGDGTLDFPIVVPAGRHGMQPNLSVSYNNNGSSGIAGYGWDIAIPYISVDTKFGVPQYDTAKETESYLFNGEELMLKNGSTLYLPHRATTTMNRVNGTVTFVPKVEGSFSKIQRIGNSPSTYTWVVWEKSGMKYYYGQTASHRLSSGVNSGNIAKWMLNKVEDKNGNYIQYNYTLKTYNEGNLAGGKELLINQIVYNLHVSNSGTVSKTLSFTYDSALREDAGFNLRYGFKEVNASKLLRIGTDERGSHSVSYEFVYKQGRFGKTLLDYIETNNHAINTSSGTESYKHTFEYYDDISDGLYKTEKTINLYDDFQDEKHAALSSTIESYQTHEVNIGAGVSPIANPPAWWPFSYGGTINFAFPSGTSIKNSPTMLLLDIDGDGLDDKVMKIGSDIKYRKNLGGTVFSQELYKAHNIYDLGLFENNTQTDPERSISIIAGSFNASKSQTNARVRTFLSDVNGDGLVDYVKDRIVYFNRMNPSSGLPTFTDDSNLTPNRIFKEGDVDPGISAPLPHLALGNDLMDVVKVWVAPKSGTINITGTIAKQFVSADNGIRYAIQKSGSRVRLPHETIHYDPNLPTVPWNPSSPILGVLLDPNPSSYIIEPTLLIINPQSTNKSGIPVVKGDYIYFRVNSSQLPDELVNVTWDPEITYVTENFDSPNQYKQYSSKYSDAYIYGSIDRIPFIVTENGSYKLQWNSFAVNNLVSYPELTDDVEIILHGYKMVTDVITNTVSKQPLTGSNTEIARRTIKSNVNNTVAALNQSFNFTDINGDDPESYKYFEIEVFTTSQINWKKLDTKFIPKLVNTQDNSTRYITPQYKVFNSQLTKYYKSTFTSATTITINHNFSLSSCTDVQCGNKTIYMVVKNQNGKIVSSLNGLPAKFKYIVGSNGNLISKQQFNGTSFAALTGNNSQITASNTSLYFEYYAEDSHIASRLNTYQNNANLLSSSNGNTQSTGTNNGLHRANIFYHNQLSGFGTLYRNWGQFAYKGAQPNENFRLINKSYLSKLALSGISSTTEPSQQEIDMFDDLMNQNIEDIDYDFDSESFTVGGTTIGLNQSQIDAALHFTMLQPDRLNEAWSSHTRLYVKSGEMSPYLRYDNGAAEQMFPIPAPTSIGTYGAVSIVKESFSNSHSKGRSISFFGFSLGKTTSEGTSRQLNDFMDINGDGYPDVVGDKIQLTSYRGGLTNTFINKSLLGTTTSNGTGKATGGSTAHISSIMDRYGRPSSFRIGNNTTFASIGAGTNKFETVSKPEKMLIDLNGDGLVDLIRDNGAVEFNTGNSFTTSTWAGYGTAHEQHTTSRSVNAHFGGGFTEFIEPISIGAGNGGNSSSNLDLSFGFSGSRSVTQEKKNFIDINGDGLPDYISEGTIYFNTGTHHINSGLSLPQLSESSSVAHGETINGSILIPISIPIIGIIIKVGGGGGKSWIKNYNEDNVSFRDFDGDGYVDIVQSASETELKVRLSKIGRTNMLKMVYNPTGSTIEIDYATYNVVSNTSFGSNYKMPFKKWVLSSVKVNDGFVDDGENVQRYAFEYKNGLKDRRERKFLGFGEVKTYQLNRIGDIYRSVIQKYLLDEMPNAEIYLPGSTSDSRKYQYIGNLLREESSYDGMQRLLSSNSYEYTFYPLNGNSSPSTFSTSSQPALTYSDTSRIVPLVKRNIAKTRHYQGNSETSFIEDQNIALFNQYDQYGNVIMYRDNIDDNDVEIDYHYLNNTSKYLVAIPKEHRVKMSGALQRKTATVIDTKGNITQISRFNQNDVSVTDYVYDDIGNIRKLILPKPSSSASESQRMYYQYEYDNTYKQFVTSITDAQGLSSESVYTNFGLLLSQKDANGVVFSYKYDPSRRLKEFRGPYNTKWTIKNEYKIGTNGLYYAVTKHNIKDEQQSSGAQILYTSSFADGLGRIIQTKKQLDLLTGCPSGTGYRFAVSGSQIYDEFGRVVESYLGQEELDCSGSVLFLDKLENYTPLTHIEQEKTSITYDMQDRLLQSHIHGLNATTSYQYGFENDGFGMPRSFEKLILPEENISVTFKDHKGRVTTTKQVGDGTELITKYKYNKIGELLEVIDAENKTTAYKYDMFGQKINVEHPDNGTSTFAYDLTGKLRATATQNLINSNQSITYNYSFNQLKDIVYPSHTVSYQYGVAGAPDHTAGRVKKVVDLTGDRTLKYGKLGEITEETRRLYSQNTGELHFTTNYRYDSWGRIMEMTYPDGEHLTYSYNSVGQLRSIVNDNGEVYLANVIYNFFDQPTSILYGNGVVTTNSYDITQRVRAMQLDRPDLTTFMKNVYDYDKNQNITAIRNDFSQHGLLRLGGISNKNYTYDKFNRLLKAEGVWEGYNENHNYDLNMKYSATHGIVEKRQFHQVNNPGFAGESENSYLAAYKYDNPDHPHAVSEISYSGIGGNQNAHSKFTYDANGNMIEYDTNFGSFSNRKMIWDEQNRLMAVIDNGDRINHYLYDHAGERTFKSEGTVSYVNIGGQNIYSVLDFREYLLYPSGYIVVNLNKNEYSKHYYINGKRFVSRIDNNAAQFIPHSARGNEDALGAPLKQQSDGLDLSSLVGVQNITYSIDIGNSEADCLAQINAIKAIFMANNNPPDLSLQHCIDYINELINNPNLTKCEALVLLNQYQCEPEAVNIPDDTLTPIYTPGEMEQFDCLTELNILIAEYTPFMIELLDSYPETYEELYNCGKLCRPYSEQASNCVVQFNQTGEWTQECKELLQDCGCLPTDDCFREALVYINNNLTLEPESNACEVLEYVKANFDCLPPKTQPAEPEVPEDTEDDWIDDGGNSHLPGGDGPYREEYRKPIWWYHTDHLGSSTYLTDNFGRPSHYYETLPFGEMMVEHNQSANVPSGMGYDNKYKFNGKELDDATGMYYYGARYYDPRISIFVSVDPLAEQTMTPYQYVTNNPIMFTDPTGMVQDDVYRREGDKFIFVRKNNENEGTKDHVGVFSQNANGEYVQDTNKDGSLKYEAQDIAEGILKDGISFTNSVKYYDVGGDNGLVENDILDFAVKLQSMVKKEISGYALSDKSVGGEITGMMIEPYKGAGFNRAKEFIKYENTSTASNSKQYKAMKAITTLGNKLGKSVYPFYHFHTHPDTASPSGDDKLRAGSNDKLPHYIIDYRFNKKQYGKHGFF